jgi:hypothetical protein
MRGRKGYARDRKNNFKVVSKLIDVPTTADNFDRMEDEFVDKKNQRCIESIQKRERKLENRKYKRALKQAVMVQKIARKQARVTVVKNQEEPKQVVVKIEPSFSLLPEETMWESIEESKEVKEVKNDEPQPTSTLKKLTSWLW